MADTQDWSLLALPVAICAIAFVLATLVVMRLARGRLSRWKIALHIGIGALVAIAVILLFRWYDESDTGAAIHVFLESQRFDFDLGSRDPTVVILSSVLPALGLPVLVYQFVTLVFMLLGVAVAVRPRRARIDAMLSAAAFACGYGAANSVDAMPPSVDAAGAVVFAIGAYLMHIGAGLIAGYVLWTGAAWYAAVARFFPALLLLYMLRILVIGLAMGISQLLVVSGYAEEWLGLGAMTAVGLLAVLLWMLIGLPIAILLYRRAKRTAALPRT